jgi:hypothetical protein
LQVHPTTGGLFAFSSVICKSSFNFIDRFFFLLSCFYRSWRVFEKRSKEYRAWCSDRDRWGASVFVSVSASAAVAAFAAGGAASDSDYTSTMVGLAVDRDEAAMDETIMQGHPDFIRSVMVHM